MGLVQRVKTAANVFAGSFRGHCNRLGSVFVFDTVLKCFDFSVL